MKIELWDDVRSLDRQLDEIFRPFFALPMPRFTGRLIPPLDVFYKEGNLVVHVDLPGVDPDKVKVTVERHTLVIRGERERTHEVGKEHF